METYCASGPIPPKYRSNNFYHNVPTCARTIRTFGSEYALPNTKLRSPLSLAHSQSVWQERLSPRGPRSCLGIAPQKSASSRGKYCTIILAIASFLVLIAVLAIAGLALYMGALHTETSNALLNFSCSAKILRGDRFIGGLQEKARRYKRQLDALYERSTLGPAFISSTIEKFGNDTLTFYFKLSFNKRKFSKNITSLEKNIKDILLNDAISKKTIFRNIRFDPRSIQVKQIQENEDNYQTLAINKEPKKSLMSSTVLKSSNNAMVAQQNSTTKASIIKDEIDIKEENLPVIHGSFRITKTEADISEKKTDSTTPKAKYATTPHKKTTYKETSITSALYKIAAVEKITKTPNVKLITTFSTTVSPVLTTPISKSSSIPVQTINPQRFDEEPWIPILPNQTQSNIVLEMEKTSSSPPTNSPKRRQPIYTSFTNPGLTFNFFNTERLGSTSLKSHPIPVNKIPHTTDISTLNKMERTSASPENSSISDYIKIDTVTYEPEFANENLKKEQELKNISTIFHTLVSTLEADKINLSFHEDSISNFENNKTSQEQLLGHGQVEVVEGDIEDLMLQTTKLPLVTLIPVKSNSGIGRPLRKKPPRPGTNNLSVENRSFPSNNRLNLNNAETKADTKNDVNVFKIMGILNFATESNLEGDNPKKSQDLVRYPKMGSSNHSNEIVIFATNSSVTSSRSEEKKDSVNILSPEQIQQLSEISNVHDNTTILNNDNDFVISNKAVSSSYTLNHGGFKILTKTLNKISNFGQSNTINKEKNKLRYNSSECGNFSIKCGDGKCLPDTTKCNQLIDCSDGRDEKNCNCADYLRSQYLLRKICDGIVDCWDFSDENQCEWCEPNQYVCSNSKVCIDKRQICDGMRDCPQGDDERQCVTIASNLKAAEEFPYYSEGYLMIRKYGYWGKLCIDNFENFMSKSYISWEISDLGRAVCKSMTYQNMKSIKTIVEPNEIQMNSKYFELSYSSKNETSNLSFKETLCDRKNVVKVTCESLECGARPQAIKHIARVVGGGNAGLGAWPWQAALYKEGEFQCGATLLSNRWLVSAGHCFYHSQGEHWVVRLGALRRGTTLPSPYEQLRSIIRILIHPGYVDMGFINDISLLQMEFPVVFSDYVRPVCLPKTNKLPLDGSLCTVIGWGQLFEVGRIFPDTLQEVQVPIISTVECRKRTLFLPLYRITDDMFCAGYERGGRDACLGDSGGPLMCPESNGRWTLHGITSNGYGCARANRPGVYTKVANYLSWIYSNMNNKDFNNKNISIIKNTCEGHRCPLGECLPESRLCNGFIECSDGSDEKNC